MSFPTVVSIPIDFTLVRESIHK
ncbi:hypothetical protein RHRU231_470260 [Rhodococcus ruber]|uniref:Uncharacterized protein n=1 Tax=Rhodococcus ruber TaxID=1830 RepID=A0A098BMG4_9NOCA|nr:hypothetical protein RHRU231_470260 [Rhodococcus ruber]